MQRQCSCQGKAWSSHRMGTMGGVMHMAAGSMTISTRVTRRSLETPTPDKINTSEYFQQIFETPGRPQAKVCSDAARCCNDWLSCHTRQSTRQAFCLGWCRCTDYKVAWFCQCCHTAYEAAPSRSVLVRLQCMHLLCDHSATFTGHTPLTLYGCSACLPTCRPQRTHRP